VEVFESVENGNRWDWVAGHNETEVIRESIKTTDGILKDQISVRLTRIEL
jgi:hypothetical protein